MKNLASDPLIPDGFVLVKKGGRPKNEARDAGVFLAKVWRTQHCSETATVAEQWIVDSWERIGSNESRGIGETAHVRAAIKRAKDRGLNQSLLMIDQASGLCTAVELERHDSSSNLKDGARSWHWKDGMPLALEGRVKNLRVTADHQEIMHRSAIGSAVIALTRGQG